MGVKVATSVADAASDADVVITMVTNAEAVRSIAGDQGLIQALRPGAVWAQMSTIGIEATEQVAALVARERPDTYFVDVPVSGSKVPAENGDLLIFASGPDDARPHLQPVFDVIGQRTMWLGPAGNGSKMKLVNNVLLAFTAEGVTNSLAFEARQLGVEHLPSSQPSTGDHSFPPGSPGRLRRIERGDYSPSSPWHWR